MDTAGELHQATLLNRKHLDLDVRAVIATAAHRLFAGRPHAVNRVASPVWNSSCGSRDLSMITDLRKDLGIEIIEEENGYHEIVNQNVARSHSPVSH